MVKPRIHAWPSARSAGPVDLPTLKVNQSGTAAAILLDHRPKPQLLDAIAALTGMGVAVVDLPSRRSIVLVYGRPVKLRYNQALELAQKLKGVPK